MMNRSLGLLWCLTNFSKQMWLFIVTSFLFGGSVKGCFLIMVSGY